MTTGWTIERERDRKKLCFIIIIAVKKSALKMVWWVQQYVSENDTENE